jgi:hypothetical protein
VAFAEVVVEEDVAVAEVVAEEQSEGTIHICSIQE